MATQKYTKILLLKIISEILQNPHEIITIRDLHYGIGMQENYEVVGKHIENTRNDNDKN